MPQPRASLLLRLRSAPQVILVILAWGIAEFCVRTLRLPVSGGVLGLGFLLSLLLAGVVPLRSIKRGADWLLAEMSLFFVPAVLAVLDHRELLGSLAAKAVLVIVGSTAAVMAVTALLVELLLRAPGAPALAASTSAGPAPAPHPSPQAAPHGAPPRSPAP